MPTARLTNADVDAMVLDEWFRYELIDGELHLSTPSTFVHQEVLGDILMAFRDYLRSNPVGKIAPGVGVIFDDFNGVIPDLVYISHERRKRILKEGHLYGTPEIAIEILSPGSTNIRRDRHLKRNLYSSRGVDEYWIVDPESRTVEIHRKQREGGLDFLASLQETDELTTPLLTGFRTQVAAFFET
jgi:Uma2 family endonuclease